VLSRSADKREVDIRGPEGERRHRKGAVLRVALLLDSGGTLDQSVDLLRELWGNLILDNVAEERLR
jgi:hypothetical protein